MPELVEEVAVKEVRPLQPYQIRAGAKGRGRSPHSQDQLLEIELEAARMRLTRVKNGPARRRATHT